MLEEDRATGGERSGERAPVVDSEASRCTVCTCHTVARVRNEMPDSENEDGGDGLRVLRYDEHE